MLIHFDAVYLFLDSSIEGGVVQRRHACSVDGPNGWTDLGARRGVVSEVWTIYVRSRMEHTYAFLLRLRANSKTALFRATPLPIVIVFLFGPVFFRGFRQL